jgi:hypothetical protein
MSLNHCMDPEDNDGDVGSWASSSQTPLLEYEGDAPSSLPRPQRARSSSNGSAVGGGGSLGFARPGHEDDAPPGGRRCGCRRIPTIAIIVATLVVSLVALFLAAALVPRGG